MRIALALGLAMVAGCGPSLEDPDGFAREFAGIWCDRQETCALGEFQDAYDDPDDCFADRSEDPHIHDSDKSGCGIDLEAADACLTFMSDADDCSDWDHKEVEEACEHVYVDCD